MERETFEINHCDINAINDTGLSIKNKEYNDIRIEGYCVYVLCQDLILSYNLYISEDQERFFNDMKSNSFIDGIRSRRLYHNISYDVYKELLSEAIDSAQKSTRKFPPRYYICPFHIIRQSEVESFYEYTSSIVINGIECNGYVDAGIGHIGYHDKYPGYIEVSDKYKEIIATIPQEDLKMITVGDYKDGLFKINIIPKKFIDKIILHRKYLHTDCIEFSLEKFYTGEENVYELDPQKPDPEVLEMMKKYRVIEERE